MTKKETILIPPIKCQGIKTKLIPFIKENIKINPDGRWIEPFVGSGVVAFNIAPEKAILSDKNQYTINFYNSIQNGKITSQSVREFLEYHGSILQKQGSEYYYEMRDEFNKNGDPLYFLFLNRSDFNGVIRFNKKGEFNVPFCRNEDRFSKTYITKICNQVEKVSMLIKDREWEFKHCVWQETFNGVSEKDYIYLDPPYIGRDTSYVGEWPEREAVELAAYAHKTPANVALSMWKEDDFRKNDYLYKYWSDFTWHEQEHFYFVGGKEINRHPVKEVLAVKY